MISEFVFRLLVIAGWISFLATAGVVLRAMPRKRGEKISPSRWAIFITTILLTAAFIAAVGTAGQ